MDQVSLWLSILLGVAMVAWLAPGILRAQRGQALRNIALWLMIILGLALFYRSFGPFHTAGERLPANAAQEDVDGASSEISSTPEGFSPPRE